MNARVFLLGWVLAWPASGPVQAAESLVGAVTVTEAWIRPAPPDAPVRAGYARIENHGDVEVVIDAARSEAFDAVEIHEMHIVDGMMRMRPVPQLRLPPHESVALAPGGLHLMLFRPTLALEMDAAATIVFLHGDEEVARGHFVVGEGSNAGASASEHEHAH